MSQAAASVSLDTPTVRRIAAVSGAALLVGYVPMARWESRMRATGGPGIVRLQLAGDVATASSILVRWGPDGREAARQQTWADFAWMQTYGIAGVAGLELLRRRAEPGSWVARGGRLARWLPYAAVGFDVIEGVGQLRTLAAWESPSPRTVARTSRAARAKWGLLAASIAWAGITGLSTVRGGRVSRFGPIVEHVPPLKGARRAFATPRLR